jgi:hypothetical protein
MTRNLDAQLERFQGLLGFGYSLVVGRQVTNHVGGVVEFVGV